MVQQNKTPKKAERSPEEVRKEANERRAQAKRDFKKSGALKGQKLVAKPRKGYTLYWALDDDKGSLDKCLDKGYTFARRSKSSKAEPCDGPGGATKVRAGVKKNGEIMYQYLMEIPEEIYAEDQAEKELKVRRTEDAIRGGFEGNPNMGGNSGQYDPTKAVGGVHYGKKNAF